MEEEVTLRRMPSELIADRRRLFEVRRLRRAIPQRIAEEKRARARTDARSLGRGRGHKKPTAGLLRIDFFDGPPPPGGPSF